MAGQKLASNAAALFPSPRVGTCGEGNKAAVLEASQKSVPNFVTLAPHPAPPSPLRSDKQ